MNPILLAFVAFVVPAALLVLVWTGLEKPKNVTAESEFAFLNEHYSRLASVPVILGNAGKDGFDCIIDFQDGTLGLGMGETPWEAYNSAQKGERYLGTTGL